MTDQTVGGHTVSTIRAGRAVITLGTRLDALEAQQLRATVDGLLADGVQELLVDLSVTEFIDSAGLASLIRAMTLLDQRQGRIELVRPKSENAWRVFRLTKFDEVFTVHTEPPSTGEDAP
jgi:anti-sigma B factor antagonist